MVLGRAVGPEREHLPNSPLIDVSCEIRFAGDLSLFGSWGEVQARLRHRYPKVLVPIADPGKAPLLQAVRLASDDQTAVVMLALNSFAVSTRSYGTYRQFKNQFDEALDAFRPSLHQPTLTRFGLRYVNVLPSGPGEGQRVHSALRLEVGGIAARWKGHPVLVLETEQGRLTLRISLLQPAAPSPGPGIVLDPGVHLDFDCFTTTPPASLDELAELMDEAHDVIDRTFFETITDEYLQYLRGDSPT
jgi:uncharacterized protein (TIGR04255 family)